MDLVLKLKHICYIISVKQTKKKLPSLKSPLLSISKCFNHYSVVRQKVCLWIWNHCTSFIHYLCNLAAVEKPIAASVVKCLLTYVENY